MKNSFTILIAFMIHMPSIKTSQIDCSLGNEPIQVPPRNMETIFGDRRRMSLYSESSTNRAKCIWNTSAFHRCHSTQVGNAYKVYFMSFILLTIKMSNSLPLSIFSITRGTINNPWNIMLKPLAMTKVICRNLRWSTGAFWSENV